MSMDKLTIFEIILSNCCRKAVTTEMEHNPFHSGKFVDKEKEPLTLKSAGSSILGDILASVAPMITGLVAGGMLKVVLLLLRSSDLLSYAFCASTVRSSASTAGLPRRR